MKEYYEAHITMRSDPAVRMIVEDYDWKFSAIDGDPDLGEGVKCYATRHFNKRVGLELVKLELGIVASLLRDKGCKVLRRKVELVIYDEREKD